jgi:hypothetical protein
MIQCANGVPKVTQVGLSSCGETVMLRLGHEKVLGTIWRSVEGQALVGGPNGGVSVGWRWVEQRVMHSYLLVAESRHIVGTNYRGWS